MITVNGNGAYIQMKILKNTKCTDKEKHALVKQAIRIKNKINDPTRDIISVYQFKATGDINFDIDKYDAFRSMNIVELERFFQIMIEQFDWDSIRGLIHYHSLFGEAYYNAVNFYAIRHYPSGEIDQLRIPPENLILREFGKLMKKLKCAGFEIDPAIEKYIIWR